jgi:hypothetical protein
MTFLVPLFFRCWIVFFVGKKIVFGGGTSCRGQGGQRDDKGQKKIFYSIFFTARAVFAVNSPHNRTCGARAVPCGILAEEPASVTGTEATEVREPNKSSLFAAE